VGWRNSDPAGGQISTGLRVYQGLCILGYRETEEDEGVLAHLPAQAALAEEGVAGENPTAPIEAGDQPRRDGQFRLRLVRIADDLFLRQHRTGLVSAGGQGMDGAGGRRRAGEATTLRLAVDGDPFPAAHRGIRGAVHRAVIGQGGREQGGIEAAEEAGEEWTVSAQLREVDHGRARHDEAAPAP
jgi:hypothetical protein